MEVSPIGYHVTVEPNSIETFVLTIQNTKDTGRRYHVDVRDGQQVSAPSAIAAWVQVPEDFTIPPGESQTIEVVATIPPIAIPGDRYIYVVVSEHTSEAPLSVQSEAGIPITVTVAGEIEELVTASLDLVQQGREYTGTAIFRNTGMVAVPVQGTLTLRTDRQGDAAIVPMSTVLRAGESTTIGLHHLVSPWYIGAVWLEVEATYGVFDTPIQDTLRQYVVGYGIWWSAGGVVTVSIFILWRLNKR